MCFPSPDWRRPGSRGWYERDDDRIEATGERRWLTVDSRHIPNLPPELSGLLSVFTDEKTCEGGRIEIASSWPDDAGTELYAHTASVLPPLDAVFLRGSDAVGQWLEANGWGRDRPYNDNFRDKSVAAVYERVWFTEYPLYLNSDIFAVLGGWHLPWPEGDWHQLLEDDLLVFTIRDSEPWVEVWADRNGGFRVMQRIT